jgi:hypothetical protein
MAIISGGVWVPTGQTNLGAGLNFRSNWLDFEAEHRKIGPNFNPQVGFIERTDCVCDSVNKLICQSGHFYCDHSVTSADVRLSVGPTKK